LVGKHEGQTSLGKPGSREKTVLKVTRGNWSEAHSIEKRI